MKKKYNKVLYILSLIVVLGYPIYCIISSLVMDGFKDFFDNFITSFMLVPALGFEWGFVPFKILTILYICCFIYLIYYFIKRTKKSK